MQAQEAHSPPLRLAVHLQDYASMPRWQARKAQSIAERIYLAGDISLEWLDCSPALQGLESPQPCNEPLRPSTLTVQFLTRKMANGVPVSTRVFGYATPAGRSGFGNRVGIFYGRIDDYCTAHGFLTQALLGVVIAHEMGHLLLGSGSHAARGLMTCPWGKEDTRNAARGRLNFGPSRMALIRQAVRARMLADRSQSPPTVTSAEVKLVR